ncbi:MAG: hypothetical protein L0207_05740 [Chlamydiae bacterium]|nr:hypothetical protein [Chlamydiota bacterium]
MKKKNKQIKSSPNTQTDVKKQELWDIEHLISADLGTFFLMNEEGQTNQIETARQKARSDFLKHRSDMQKIAREMGGEFPQVVQRFISSVDEILHSGQWVDQSKINAFHQISKNLEEQLGTHLLHKRKI